MKEPVAVVVPKELYYHEVAYVRSLEARVARLEAALEEIAERRFLAETMIEIARAALKDAPQKSDDQSSSQRVI